ncbi:alpha-1,2-fucosyltransferase [Butyrivibrio sp. AE2032]|uniref:alpha-1,2-fucosyltransferase n=1 Tax=Butyrivibrio sp. AE2032 TaxID=1458463 RepID=UPI000552A330|nr:alpha-1,2-fucosyltransferase [Butyrivibrio sp. AE2032]
MKDVCIFGAGEWGRIAKDYFKQFCNILCFIDNDKSLWGEKVDGIDINSPDYLKGVDCNVVIANKRFFKEICKQLKEEYGIDKVTVFEVDIRNIYICDGNNDETDVDTVVVRFKGGLGNQMFIYAVYTYYMEHGIRVKADLSPYINPKERTFVLDKVFPGISIDSYKYNYNTNDFRYKEPKNIETDFVFNKRLLEIKNGFVDGYFQSYKYADLVKNSLIEKFQFRNPDKSFNSFVLSLDDDETVGVHVRRGDYLLASHRNLGNAYSSEYYFDAIKIIRERISNPKFVVVSDDIDWVKNNFTLSDIIFVDRNNFEVYEDWYDMYLLSKCRHNIIANSSFSWWGAWLNNNKDKIVIAPKRWMVGKKEVMKDICPPEWIRI